MNVWDILLLALVAGAALLAIRRLAHNASRGCGCGCAGCGGECCAKKERTECTADHTHSACTGGDRTE